MGKQGGKIWRTVDGDGGDSDPGVGFGLDLVLGEVGFGLVDELLGRDGTARPDEGRGVDPIGDGGSSHEGRTQAEE